MQYCNRCLYPSNHPYGLIFDKYGVCSGCLVHEEKDLLNWSQRIDLLKNIVLENKKHIGQNNFDCIVPVYGGGDSYFTVHVVKNILGMNPLLVHYNSEFNTKIGIRNLANLATVFDCDMVTSTLAPSLLKRITRASLKKYGNLYWQVLAGRLTFPVQVAVKYKIPLIFWGVQPWSEQNGMFQHINEVEMTERCRKEHGLFGISAEDLIGSENLSRSEMQPFIYPYDNEIEAIGVRGIYLSNYIRWDSKKQHEKMIDLYGYETSLQQRTFNTYEDVHCFHSAGLHDYLKYIKLGYGKITDHASREIRLKRMTRGEGIQLVNNLKQIEPDDLDVFLNWVELTNTEFKDYYWDKRDLRIWKKNKNEEWNLIDSIINYSKGHLIEKASLIKNEECNFILTENAEPNIEERKYLLMGRNYINKNNYGAIQNNVEGGSMTKRKWKDNKIES
jgi:N-acetyl sugar amidotransferase